MRKPQADDADAFPLPAELVREDIADAGGASLPSQTGLECSPRSDGGAAVVVLCSSSKSWLETNIPLISPVVGWVLIVAGWAVVHRTGKYRARRQEELAIVDALERRLEQLRGRTILYYTSVKAEGVSQTADSDRRKEERSVIAAKRREEEFHIKHELVTIRATIALLHLRKPKHYVMNKDFTALRHACLGNGFESAERELVDHSSPVIPAISTKVQRLVAKLRIEFENANPDKLWATEPSEAPKKERR